VPEDWVCSDCKYSNVDDTAMFCSRCGKPRNIFIGVDYRKFGVSPGSATYAYSTTASNAAAGWGSVWLYDELKKRYPEEEIAALGKAAEKFRHEEPKLYRILDEKIREGDEATRTLGTERDRSARAHEIINRMARANELFRYRRNAKLFTTNDPEFFARLYQPCVGDTDFTSKIASLASVFEIDRGDLDRLRALVPNYDEHWNSITLVEKMLENEKVVFDPEMIETWRTIRKLRNVPPIHQRVQPFEAYEFFGFKYPISDYQQFWDTILERFLYSLSRFVEVLSRLPEKETRPK